MFSCDSGSSFLACASSDRAIAFGHSPLATGIRRQRCFDVVAAQILMGLRIITGVSKPFALERAIDLCRHADLWSSAEAKTRPRSVSVYVRCVDD